jgi:hypothetical protein
LQEKLDMVGNDLEMAEEWDKYLATNAVERAAFANGRRSRQAEIDGLREALRTVHTMLNTPQKYKARDARLYLERFFVGRDRERKV